MPNGSKKVIKVSANPLSAVSPLVAAIERPVTTAEVASHLRVTERTIANYRQNGVIPFWRVTARKCLYRISDVERALALNK